MSIVPSFLLRRLYVNGSLRNNSHGFEFELKNTLGSGYGTQLLPVALDKMEIPLEDCYYVADGGLVPFSQVSKDNRFTLAMNKALTMTCEGIKLSPGPHRLRISFVAEGIGKLGFEVTDTVADART